MPLLFFCQTEDEGASRMHRHFITMFGEQSPRRPPRDHAFVIANFAYLPAEKPERTPMRESGQTSTMLGGIVAELRLATICASRN
jgi:hypothetical protein